MEYTIRKLAQLSGVSSRTLRYYDEIGLLRPSRATAAGYRVYGEKEVDLLQQILFYRALDMPLAEIGRIVHTPGFDHAAALRGHLAALRERQEQLDLLIHTVTKTLASLEGDVPMQDTQKFEGFKQRLVRENEAQYGAEVREKHGDAAADEANARLLRMSSDEYGRFRALEEEIRQAANEAVRAHKEPTGETGRRITALHREWLGFTWGEVAPEAHAGLAQMYPADERFTAYYDHEVPGCAQFLCDAVQFWAGRL